jgi:L-fuculose-phosphate aldolase
MTASRRIDRSVLAVAREIDARGLVIGTTGNVSARVAGDIRITPTRQPYACLRGRDLVTVALDGTVLRGCRPPSRETPLHLAVYRRRVDVGGVVHTHSPYATAWGMTGHPLNPGLEDQSYYEIGVVSCLCGNHDGGTGQPRDLGHALGSSNAVLLGNHGVLAVGRDPAAALLVARVVEHMACVAHAQITMRLAAEPHRGAVFDMSN